MKQFGLFFTSCFCISEAAKKTISASLFDGIVKWFLTLGSGKLVTGVALYYFLIGEFLMGFVSATSIYMVEVFLMHHAYRHMCSAFPGPKIDPANEINDFICSSILVLTALMIGALYIVKTWEQASWLCLSWASCCVIGLVGLWQSLLTTKLLSSLKVMGVARTLSVLPSALSGIGRYDLAFCSQALFVAYLHLFGGKQNPLDVEPKMNGSPIRKDFWGRVMGALGFWPNGPACSWFVSLLNQTQQPAPLDAWESVKLAVWMTAYWGVALTLFLASKPTWAQVRLMLGVFITSQLSSTVANSVVGKYPFVSHGINGLSIMIGYSFLFVLLTLLGLSYTTEKNGQIVIDVAAAPAALAVATKNEAPSVTEEPSQGAVEN